MMATTVSHPLPGYPPPPPSLRICSLLPSATETVGRLGLADFLVCITHCCDVAPDFESLSKLVEAGKAVRATSSWIKPNTLSQADIDSMVKGTFAEGRPLYGIDADVLAQQKPTVVLTQGLCDVCAPTEAEARSACLLASSGNGSDSSHKELGAPPTILSLSPQSLIALAASFVDVAAACGVKERGHFLHRQFLCDLHNVCTAVRSSSTPWRAGKAVPTVFVLEWVDPPFDAGHWVPEIIQLALGNAHGSSCGAAMAALANNGAEASDASGLEGTQESLPRWQGSTASKECTWDHISSLDPDVIIVCGCGLDLQRNRSDAAPIFERHPVASQLRAFREGNVFAMDGNRTLSRPGPSLVEGAAAMAACIWSGHPNRLQALQATGCLPAREQVWGNLVSG